MRARKLIALVSIVLIASLGAPPALSASHDSSGSGSILKLHKNLPKDPLMVLAFSMEDPARSFDEVLKMVREISGDKAAERLAEGLKGLDDELGISLRDDLLARLGPDLAVVIDLPPLDSLAALMGPAGASAVKQFVGGIGITGNTDNGKKLAGALKKLMVDAGAEVTKEDDLLRFGFKLPISSIEGSGESGKGLGLLYGHNRKSFALGFSEDWVRNVLSGWPAGERLEDGDDYLRVTSHLDSESNSLIYVNLPKVKNLVTSSALLKGFIASNEEVMRSYDWFTSSDFLDLGIGFTAVGMDGGTRITGFGPEWMGSGALLTGIIAAVAVPKFMSYQDEGKAKSTMADMRSVATSIEAFAVDNDQYPGPTDGFLPVGSLTDQLEPKYIRALPGNDAWGGELLYWSDTSNFKLVSKGSDGVMDQDWMGPIEPSHDESPGRDILYVDGAFAVSPEHG
jgi:type II secretory pathway pseudopilin PulG